MGFEVRRHLAVAAVSAFVGLFIFSLSISAHADSSETQNKLKSVDGALTSGVDGATFHAELKEGFHFNEKAPNLLTVDAAKIKPQMIEKRKMTFAIPSGAHRSERAMVYVCDDALTFCEPKAIEIKTAPTEKSPAKTASVIAPSSSVKTAVVVNAHGFIADNLPAAEAQATREKKLVLVDFAARWCPGCVRLETETFDTAQFKKLTKGFVKVRLDADRFENDSIKKKLGVHGIPALIVLTPTGDEITRVVDYQPMPTLISFLTEAQAHPQSLQELKARAQGGDATANALLGRHLYASDRFEESIAYLEKVKPVPGELADARVQAAREAADQDPSRTGAFLETARAIIKSEPRSSRSIVWRTALLAKLDAKSAEHAQVAKEGIQLADELLKDPKALKVAMSSDAVGEFTGYEKILLAAERADLIEAAAMGDEANLTANRLVAQVGQELNIPVTKAGPSMRHLIFLMAAHQYPEAETKARALLARDAQNPELQRRLLKILVEQKKYAEAEKVGKNLIPKSFGKNEVWVAQQLLRAHIGAGEKVAAQTLAKNYLQRPDIDWALMKNEKKDFTEAQALPATSVRGD